MKILKIQETIPADLKIVADFIDKVLEKTKNLPLSWDDFFKLKLCLEEAITNAMRHGNKLKPGSQVEFFLEADKERLIIEVKDQGKGFDPKKIPDPTKPGKVNEPSGRGVFLMKSLMDMVEYSDNGSRLKMVKVFK